MANKNIKTIEFEDLGKGINMFTRDTMIADNESMDGWNVWAVGKNSLAKRPGVVKFGEVAGVSKIDGLGAYYNGSTRKLLAMAGGSLYDVTTGSAVAVSASPASAGVFTSGNRADFCQAGGNVYIANGVESVRKFDGTTVRDQAGSIVAKYLMFYKASLWAWGNPTAGNETRLYRSGTDYNIGNFTYQNSKTGTNTTLTANKLVDSAGNFSSANVTVGVKVNNLTTGKDAVITNIDSTTVLSLDTDIFGTLGTAYSILNNAWATSKYISQSDGQILNGAFKHQDYLYPVKERSLWRANVGTDAYGLITLEMVDPARGCDSHHSIDTVENDNFMFNEIGVFATGYEPNILDQIRTNIVSLRIDPKLKSIQKSRLPNVEGIFFENHYYLSYTSGGGTFNDTFSVYDRQRLGWWEFQVAGLNGTYIGANCLCEWKDPNGQTRLYFGSPIDGSIYYFDATSKSDPGYNITTSWVSKKFGLEKNLSQVKFFLDCELYFGKTAGNITIQVYIDGELAETLTTQIGNTGTAGEGIASIGTEIIGVGGGSLELADSGGGDFVQIPLSAPGRNIQIKITDTTFDKSWELNGLIFHYKPLSELYQPNVKT